MAIIVTSKAKLSRHAQRSRITRAQFDRIVARGLPLAPYLGLTLQSVGAGKAVARLAGRPELLRPGGTIAGPALMALADFTLYAVVLSVIGPVEGAVTTSLTMNFLRRSAPGMVIAEGRMIKCGKRLAYGEVTLYSKSDADPVAHATATYSVPPSPGS
ncbi:MAG: PaaI family thioesterase [Alphaproteobacteria bacterium]|nr:PaaI family thioesterase [Alphaproteobacteria bacterium]